MQLFSLTFLQTFSFFCSNLYLNKRQSFVMIKEEKKAMHSSHAESAIGRANPTALTLHLLLISCPAPINTFEIADPCRLLALICRCSWPQDLSPRRDDRWCFGEPALTPANDSGLSAVLYLWTLRGRHPRFPLIFKLLSVCQCSYFAWQLRNLDSTSTVVTYSLTRRAWAVPQHHRLLWV